jgi:hypothetical protein
MKRGRKWNMEYYTQNHQLPLYGYLDCSSEIVSLTATEPKNNVL